MNERPPDAEVPGARQVDAMQAPPHGLPGAQQSELWQAAPLSAGAHEPSRLPAPGTLGAAPPNTPATHGNEAGHAPAGPHAPYGLVPGQPARAPHAQLPAPHDLVTRSLPDRVDWRSVTIFLAIAFAGAWLAALPLWLGGQDLLAYGTVMMQLLLAIMMYAPTIATLIVVFFVQRPPSPGRLLGLHFRPPGRTILFIGIGIVVPPLMYALGSLIAITAGFAQFDRDGEFIRTLPQIQEAPGIPAPVMAAILIINTLLFTLPISSILAFGEELGWRGWLLPNLRPLGTWPALLLSGVIWGLWHAPIILLGYNFEDRGPAGLAAMTAFCILTGIFTGWLRLRTASVYPAVIAHGSINAFSIIVLLLTGPEGFSQPFVNGTGWTLWIPYAMLAIGLAVLGGFHTQPLPGLTREESEAIRTQALSPQGTQEQVR